MVFPNLKTRTGSLTLHRRLLVALLLISLVLPSAYGSARKKSGKSATELRFWHSTGSYNKDVLNSIVETYNQENKQNRAAAIFQGNEEELYLKLLTQETRPDVVQIPVQFLPSLKEKGLITELDPLLSNKSRDDIPRKFWDTVSIEGKVYGMPFSYNVSILYVNQQVLRSAGVRQDRQPASWAEIQTIIQKIKENTRDIWALYIPMETMINFVSFVQSYTGKPLFQGSRVRIDTAEVAEAMKFLQDLMYVKHGMPPRITTNEGEGLFLSGKVGLMQASSSFLVYTESNLPYDLGVWHLPSKKATPPIATASCLALMKTSPKREKDAFKFIDFLTNRESAIKWHTHTGSPAIRTSVRESLDLLISYEESPNYMSAAIELDKGKFFNPPLDYLRETGASYDYLGLTKILTRALAEIMINAKEPAKVLEAAQREIDGLNNPQ